MCTVSNVNKQFYTLQESLTYFWFIENLVCFQEANESRKQNTLYDKINFDIFYTIKQ